MEFITQPFGLVRLGDFLLSHLADPQWTGFRAAIAFVKRSGTKFIRVPLRDFCNRAQAKISVGIDLYSTSREGLSDLLEATSPEQVFVYHNPGPSTFHPKIYLFKSAQRADVLVGSGNLTEGGLFTNYEASLAVTLDLAIPDDEAFLQLVEVTLDTWITPQQGTCYTLTAEFLVALVASGLVRSEAQIAAMKQAVLQESTQETTPQTQTEGETTPSATGAQTLFTAVAVPAPPSVPATPPVAVTTALPPPQTTTPPEPSAEEPDEIEHHPVGVADDTPTFIVSVLTVDLPVVGSSNEVTITKFIRNVRPEFWGWNEQFEGPDAVTGQYRRNIRIRFGAQVIQAYLMDYPGRKPDGTKASADFRLGSIAPIVAALYQEDDLIVLSRSAEPNVDYLARVVRVGEPEHEQLMNGLQVYARSRSNLGTYRKYRYIP